MLEPMPIKQVIQQFDAKHGSDGIVIDGWVYYSDGATRENSPWGVLAEPPTDPWQCSKLQLAYWEKRLANATREFAEKKQQLQQWGKNAIRELTCRTPCAPPEEKEVEKLRELRETVLSLQQKVAAAREKVHRNRPEHLKERERFAAENRARYEAILQDITEITI